MRIVIAGGGGFIGSALLKHLSRRHECVCFGHATRYEELSRAGAEMVAGDIADEALVRKVARGADALIFTAGTGGEAVCLADPARAVMTHVYGAHLLLREAARNHVEQYIFTSTIAVYGTYSERPQPLAEDMPVAPDDFYGALKAAAEREIIDSGRYRIFRPANVYGYGSGLFSLSSGVAGRFVQMISEGRPLQIYGDGSQMIDYLHVDDLCRAYEMAIEGESRDFIYNLGGGASVSVRRIAELVCRIAREELGIEAAIEYREAPQGKLWPDRRLSIKKIEAELGWRPEVGIEAGLKEMIANWCGEDRRAGKVQSR